MNAGKSPHTMYNEEARQLRGRLASVQDSRKRIEGERRKLEAAYVDLQSEERSIRDQLRLIDKFRGAVSFPGDTPTEFEAGILIPVGIVQAPIDECVTQRDWVINLLRANSEGLTQEQIISYVVPRIQTKSRSRPKAVRDALSHLVCDGRIHKSNGVYHAEGSAQGQLQPGL